MRPVPTRTHSPLVEALKTYDRHDRRRFHVPAHAGQNLYGPAFELLADPFRFDLTELDGLDVLSEPSGAIAEAQARIARLFGVSRSFMLVNGASVGLMAAMLSVTQPGDSVLVPRNAHRSVLSGLILAGVKPVWFLPERLPEWGLWGAVTVRQIAQQLDTHPEAKALFVTSPTYEGIGSDIAEIARLCKNRGVALVVDEAHGSLWPLSDELPVSACQSGADIVIHSLHKSGGSLTQSALAHLPEGSAVAAEQFQQALNTLQTTSPSYLLLASLDAACDFLGSNPGRRRIDWLLQEVDAIRGCFQGGLKAIQCFQPEREAARLWDPCKFYLKHPVETGEDWGGRLEAEQHIAYESASPDGVLYLANLGLDASDLAYFQQLILNEDQQLQQAQSSPRQAKSEESPPILTPEMVLSPRDAFFAKGEQVAIEQAVGRIAKETVVHCPPGIPILMPGERVQPEHVPLLPESGVWVVL